jgi:GT2 family glycosyltransferase
LPAVGSPSSTTPSHVSHSAARADGVGNAGGRPSSIDVVVVTAESRDMTVACVEALAGDKDMRVTVVDNGSQDRTYETLRERFGERVGLLRLERPAGFASACNIGYRRAGGAPFVLFLNSDILVLPDSVSRLLAALESDPGAVAAGGRLVDPQTLHTQPSYRPRRFPGLLSLAVVLTGVEARWPRNPVSRRYHGLDLREDRTQEVCQPAAAALLVRRAALDAVGGFDERFWFWFEDSDLLRRLSRLGRILWVPSAPFRHVGGASFSAWDRATAIRSRHHGMLVYGATHFGRLARFCLGTLTVLVSAGWIARLRGSSPQETRAWRAIMRGGLALMLDRPIPPIAPG